MTKLKKIKYNIFIISNNNIFFFDLVGYIKAVNNIIIASYYKYYNLLVIFIRYL